MTDKCCEHKEEMHYGTSDKQCNHPGCICLKLSISEDLPLVQTVESPVLEKIEVNKKKMGRPVGSGKKK